MSTLTLVRHGQARSFQDNPDHLTDLGFAQARRLGEVWAASGVVFDEVRTGALLRHRQTEQEVAAAFRAAGKSWPAAQADARWNEYAADAAMLYLRPLLADADPRFRALAADSAARHGAPDQNRYFQRMFEVLMLAWLEGRVESPQVEPFHVFRARVEHAVRDLLALSGNKRVAVFTSGGPIGVCVQRALRAPDRAFLDVNWRVRNCSLSEWLYSTDRFTLDSFNSVAHLPDELVTYR